MNIIIAAGACAATFSAVTLGVVQIARRARWKEALDLIPTLTYSLIAAFLWITAVTL